MTKHALANFVLGFLVQAESLTSSISGTGYGSNHKWKELFLSAGGNFAEEIGLMYRLYQCIACGAKFKHFHGDNAFDAIKRAGITDWCPDPNVLRPQSSTLPATGVNLMDPAVMQTEYAIFAESFQLTPEQSTTESNTEPKVNDD